MIRTILVLSLCLQAFTLESDLFDRFSDAFLAKNQTQLSSLLASKVELEWKEGKSGWMSKADAAAELIRFASTCGAGTSMVVSHKSDKNKQKQFAVATLRTAGKTYRITLIAKLEGGNWLLESLSFENS
ncbi:MAG: DUF4783 domain-containing protein [Bacteroidetes bacterium]|nr:MAG: DUF4783 domain-containing protein [Bacteroidota bacterium]